MTPDSSEFLLRNCLDFVQFLPQVIVISMLLIIQCYLGTLKRGVEPKFLEIGTTGTFWKKKHFNPNMRRTHRKTWQNKNIHLNMREEEGAKNCEREEKIVRGSKNRDFYWSWVGLASSVWMHQWVQQCNCFCSGMQQLELCMNHLLCGISPKNNFFMQLRWLKKELTPEPLVEGWVYLC